MDLSDGLPNLTGPIKIDLTQPAITYPNAIMSIEVPTLTAPDDVPRITYSNNVPTLTYIEPGEIELFDEGNDLLAIKLLQ